MRTNEQTYLQKLGFNDNDRKTAKHDRICLRLCHQEVKNRMLSLIVNNINGDDSLFHWNSNGYIYEIYSVLLSSPEADFSWSGGLRYDCRSKYGDKDYVKKQCKILNYKSNVTVSNFSVSYALEGKHVYFDVVYDIDLKKEFTLKYDGNTDEIDELRNDSEKEELKKLIAGDDCKQVKKLKAVIEVKNAKENVTNSIQQLNTYRGLCGSSNTWLSYDATIFVLATMYPLDELEQMVLRQNKIVWVNLLDLKKTQDS